MFNNYLMSGTGSRHYHGSRCVDVMSRRHHLSSICCYISFHVGRIGFDETLKKKQKDKKNKCSNTLAKHSAEMADSVVFHLRVGNQNNRNKKTK